MRALTLSQVAAHQKTPGSAEKRLRRESERGWGPASIEK
jgi:hypothetical protein